MDALDTRRFALTPEEVEQVRHWARGAPSQKYLNNRGEPVFQMTIPSIWLTNLLATIEHGYRDPNEDFDAEKAA